MLLMVPDYASFASRQKITFIRLVIFSSSPFRAQTNKIQSYSIILIEFLQNATSALLYYSVQSLLLIFATAVIDFVRCTCYSFADVVYVKSVTASKELQEKARSLHLPDNFYLYLDKPSCPGCPGCDYVSIKAG